MTQQQFAAILGFAFVAIWIASSLGDAVLCLLGAAAFWVVSSYLQGELDLQGINERLQGSQQSSQGTHRQPTSRR